MKRYMWQLTGAIAVAVVAFGVTTARAADAIAIDNATVQPTGPRSGTSGKAFINIEGRDVPNSAANASYAVLEFNSTDLGLPQVSRVTGMSVKLTQTLASFTSRGRLSFYITEDLTTSIQPDEINPECFFDFADIHGLNGQFAPNYYSGSREFVPVRSGTLDTYILRFPQGFPVEVYLRNQINTGGKIRLIIVPEFSNQDGELSAGTYAGYTHTNPDYHPRISVRAIPAGPNPPGGGRGR